MCVPWGGAGSCSCVGGSCQCAGGGLFVAGASVNVTRTTITGCSATAGGAILAAASANVHLSEGSILSGNRAVGDRAGAILAADCYLTISGGVVVDGNTATSAAGMLAEDNAIVSITDSTFTRNTATEGHGAAMYAISNAVVNVMRSTISGNSAAFSGGVGKIASAAAFYVTQTTMADNFARTSGGAIAAEGATVGVYSSVFRRNRCVRTGGAMFIFQSRLHLNDTIFESNAAGGGEVGILNSGEAVWSQVSSTSTQMTNLTFRDHPGGLSTFYSGAPLPWDCDPGYYMPLTGDFIGNWTGCLNPCSAGYYGTLRSYTDRECAGNCPRGYYCGEATVTPVPCPMGRVQPALGARVLQSCITCSPGAYSNFVANANSTCIGCSVGKFSEGAGASSCDGTVVRTEPSVVAYAPLNDQPPRPCGGSVSCGRLLRDGERGKRAPDVRAMPPRLLQPDARRDGQQLVHPLLRRLRQPCPRLHQRASLPAVFARQ